MKEKQGVQQKPAVENVGKGFEPKKKKNTVLIIILLVFVICFIFFVLLMGISTWFIKSFILDDMIVEPMKQKQQAFSEGYSREKEVKENIDVSEESGEKNNMYYSEEFGFSVPMQLGWEQFTVEEEMLGGDFNIADVNFFLPSQYGSDEKPGYVRMFTISVYVTESWEDSMRDKSMDEILGKVVGNNDYYTFIYSHLNGDVLDITPQTMQNMQKIIDGIKTFDVASVAYDDSEYFTEEELNGLSNFSNGDAGENPPVESINWQEYHSHEYGFYFRYPQVFTVVEEDYGWPHAIAHLILVDGGQSYDITIEVWEDENDAIDEGRSEEVIPYFMMIEHPQTHKYISITCWNESDYCEDISRTIGFIQS